MRCKGLCNTLAYNQCDSGKLMNSRIQHKKIPGCMTYVVHPGSSIKRKCCRND